jgi:hypothetical protein
VGAPYHEKFGDIFNPRVLLIDDKKLVNLRFKTIRKHVFVISEPDELQDVDMNPNDQVKVRLKLSKAQHVDWLKYKKAVAEICTQRGVLLAGTELMKVKERKRLTKEGSTAKLPTRETAFNQYCKERKVGDVERQMGRKILKGQTT